MCLKRGTLRDDNLAVTRGGDRPVRGGLPLLRPGSHITIVELTTCAAETSLVSEIDMQTPLQVDFQGVPKTSQIKNAIEKHVAQLEQRYGRVTSCRVALRAPGGHHQNGGLYEVNIQLALPNGREVNIGRTAPDDERHADLTFAINDAFKRARRRLQDNVRRLQGDVKQHDGPTTATVARLDPSGEYGFLETGDGREIYFHRNSVLDQGFSRLTVGTRVSFVEEAGEKGPQASTVKVLGKHGLRD
jgi:cold shock CspA family protein